MGEYEDFMEYVNDGNAEEVKKHFKAEYLNIPTSDTESPIHIACENGNFEIVDLFIQNNSDIEAANQNGDKPIHIACNKGHFNIVKLLCENNCNLEAEDKSKYKPLHLACQNDKIEIVELLLSKGSNIQSLNINKYTPLHCACQYGNVNVAKLLCENNCDIEAKNYNNDTPLHFVCNSGNIDIVRLLFKYNCNLDPKNSLGKSPIDVAKQNDHENIVEELQMEKIERETFPTLSFDTFRSSDSIEMVLKTIMKNKSKFITIGKGAFGTVFKWTNIKSNFTIAIKSIKLNSIGTNGIEEDINKYRNNIYHIRIVQCFGSINNSSDIHIFMENVDGGTLENKIKVNGSLQHSIIVIYIRQILEGLAFLHEQKIVHRDVKPGNILMVDDENLKLCDFGLCRLLDTLGTTSTVGTEGVTKSGRNKRTFCGTAYYMAPEIIHGHGYTVSVDIWSLGATVIQMLTGCQ